MSYFAVHYTYVSDSDALDLVRPRHREYLSSLVGDTLVASGPYPGSVPPGALLIFSADSEDLVHTQLNADPFWQEGLIAERRVQPWNPVIGSLA
ncbi:hypothetical protein BW730_08775 [Tessaracoccus aquimaris]|uniref:YCII-related domain-containing protein n=1 Tax=Tessaracoccus aquimaris TaxID=1332264 RepID=A0A1Q2CNE3_9ACTN|nr:YciI family protein [Tessaracoccus aquimaris]AQP47570.1 hypothetical protein BW730_08775 [Tessaracoccus aquimaris]